VFRGEQGFDLTAPTFAEPGDFEVLAEVGNFDQEKPFTFRMMRL
jgi:hypothetical protein